MKRLFSSRLFDRSDPHNSVSLALDRPPPMGSSFSALTQFLTSPSPPPNPSLNDIPLDVVALILTRLNPNQICRLASLNRTFRRASLSDAVWESKLPQNYNSILQTLFGSKRLDFENGLIEKRTIYAVLSRCNSVDDGSKRVWLEKSSGGMCMLVSSKGLAITGVDDRRYWSHLPTEESRFGMVAYLQQTWWLEVEGEVEFPLPAGLYSVLFRLQLGRTSKRFLHKVCNSEHVRGWDKKPARFQLWTSDGQYSTTQHFLTNQGKWIKYHVGDFVVEKPDQLTKVRFSMTQIDCTHLKGGLCIDSVIIVPKTR